MKSIWGEEESGKNEDLTGQIVKQVGGKRTSRPPEEVYLSRILTFLQGKSNLIEKRKEAKLLLLGEFGLKNRIHAKLLLGPRELEEVIRDPDDLVPALIDLLEERNPNVRTKAAKALGVRGDSRAIARLLKGLSEEKYWIRYEFATALGKMLKNIDDTHKLQEIKKKLGGHPRPGEISSVLRLVRKQMYEIRNNRDSWNDLEKVPLAKPVRVEGSGPKRPDATLKMHSMKK